MVAIIIKQNKDFTDLTDFRGLLLLVFIDVMSIISVPLEHGFNRCYGFAHTFHRC